MSVVAGRSTYRLAPGVSLPPTMPADGKIIVRIVAVEPGLEGNSLGVASGRIVTPIDGVSPNVTVFGSQFCGGAEAETCDDFRVRYLARKRYQPRAVFGWVQERVREWPCATRVCIRECSCCLELGRLDMHVFFDGTFPHGIPPQSVADEMTAWFFGDPQGFGLGEAEWGLSGRFFVATPVAIDIRVTNLPCTSATQVQMVRDRLKGLFDGLCPGRVLCRRLFDAAIVQVVGAGCAFEVEMSIGGNPLCDDFQPACDELPVAGAIAIAGGSLRA
jgi:hypothetical protein